MLHQIGSGLGRPCLCSFGLKTNATGAGCGFKVGRLPKTLIRHLPRQHTDYASQATTVYQNTRLRPRNRQVREPPPRFPALIFPKADPGQALHHPDIRTRSSQRPPRSAPLAGAMQALHRSRDHPTAEQQHRRTAKSNKIAHRGSRLSAAPSLPLPRSGEAGWGVRSQRQKRAASIPNPVTPGLTRSLAFPRAALTPARLSTPNAAARAMQQWPRSPP